jgi:hypothetical protein
MKTNVQIVKIQNAQVDNIDIEDIYKWRSMKKIKMMNQKKLFDYLLK